MYTCIIAYCYTRKACNFFSSILGSWDRRLIKKWGTIPLFPEIIIPLQQSSHHPVFLSWSWICKLLEKCLITDSFLVIRVNYRWALIENQLHIAPTLILKWSYLNCFGGVGISETLCDPLSRALVSPPSSSKHLWLRFADKGGIKWHR